MRRLFFLLALCLCHWVLGDAIQDRTLDRQLLTQLAATMGVITKGDWEAETQRLWLRRPLQERWEMEELSEDKKQAVLSFAKDLGLIEAWQPSCKSYDKAIILGATTSVMQRRLDYLKQLWEEGVSFREVVWLTGDRPLDKRVDGLMQECKNESEAARQLWCSAELPEAMRAIPVTFLATPLQKEGEGVRRPNTKDTLDAWLSKAVQPCRVLFISSQPFCGYQFSVIKACLPGAFEFDVVGYAATNPSAATILDSIARWLYQESFTGSL
ncbi:MAG: hypothetical protein FJZ63_08145 [Chlamydiae bacterium]|nr:hypothetical protein [Chlamydiota bacterium]